MQQLVGLPVPDEEREGATEKGIERETIDRLAASIDIVKPAEPVH